MSKLVGIMTAWSAEIFIEAAIKQALYMCDEVLLCVSPHSEAMKKFEDNTLEIAKKYKDKIKLIDYPTQAFCSKTKAETMNAMIELSTIKPNDWLVMLDVDEFWFKEDIDCLKEYLEDSKEDWIWTPTKYFFIDLYHYMLNEEGRFWRFKNSKDRFIVSCQWSGDRSKAVHLNSPSFFHYSTMLNPYAKYEFWRTDWPNSQPLLMQWIEEIFLKFNLKNQEYWVKKNFELFDSLQPFCKSDYKPKEDGTLFIYNYLHPEWIEELNIKDIKDFRKLYKDLR